MQRYHLVTGAGASTIRASLSLQGDNIPRLGIILGMNLNQIGQIAIHADDLSRAVAFYRDTLGMRLLFQAPPGLAFFDCGGIRLMLDAVPEKDSPERINSLLYYKVPDIQAAYETLVSRGVSFESKPHLIAKMPDHELWMAFFRDSEKNLVGLMSELRG